MWTDGTLITQFSGPVSHYLPGSVVVFAGIGHAALSLAFTLVLYGSIPATFVRSRWYGLLLFLTVFCIPLFGYLLGPAIMYWIRKYPPVVEHTFQDVHAIMPSMFEQRSHVGKIAYAGAGIRYQLQKTKGASDEKLKVLNSVVAMPGHYAVPILKNSMQDEAEDVRMVSHGMIDAREKEINEDIARAHAVLNASSDSTVQHDALRHLAMRYWDLVYFGLAEGEMLRFVYERIEHYAALALENRSDDGEVMMVLGKLALRKKEIVRAEHWFRKAEESGISDSRVHLYRAEVAFYQRDFALLRELLSGRYTFPNPGHLIQVIAFWRKRSVS